MKKTLLAMLCIGSLLLSAFDLPFVDSGNGIPQGWNLSVKEAECHVTDGVVKLSGKSTGNVYLSYPGPALEKDVAYILTCEAKCPEDGNFMVYYEYIMDKTWNSKIFRSNGTGDWQNVNIRFIKENDTKSERVLLRLMNNTSLEVRNLKIEEEKHNHGVTDSFPESAPITRFLHNGSFEWGDKYWTVLSDASVKRDKDNYSNSALCMGKFGFVVQQNIHLLPNHKYRLSWYAKAEKEAGELLVAVRNMPDKTLVNDTPYAVESTEYIRKGFDFTTQNVADPVIDIIVKNTGKQALRLTQFYLKEYTDEELSPLQIKLEQPCYRDAIFASMPCPFVQGTVIFKDGADKAEVTLTGEGYSQKTKVTSAKPSFKFPTKKMADGDYQLTVKSSTASITRIIHKYPHKENEVTIGADRNFYCDGKRFFPFVMGFLYEDPNRPVMSYLCATRGMTGVIGGGANSAPKALQSLNAAQKYNLKVQLWIGGDFAMTDDYAEQLEEYIGSILTPEVINHPALLSYNYCDEPWAREIPAYKFADAMRIFRKLDPWHPLFINESPRGVVADYLAEYAKYSDFYGVDLYPIPAPLLHSAIADKSMAAVGKYSDIYNQATGYQKPVMMWLQGYQWVPTGDLAVKPNKQEIKFMCMNALMHNTKAIALFNHRMKQQDFYNDFFSITNLVSSVEPVISTGTELPAVIKNQGLCSRAFKSDGKTYHLLLNETPEAMALDISELSKANMLPAYSNDITLEGNSMTLIPWGFSIFSSNGEMPPACQPIVPEDKELEAEKDDFLALAKDRMLPKDLADAEWIWFPGNIALHPKISLERTLKFDKPVKSAILSATADNIMQLYLDGELIIKSSDWAVIDDIDIAAKLKPEGSVLRIDATNLDGPGGLMAIINVTFQDGSTLALPSNTEWEITSGDATKKAQSFGKFGIATTWDLINFIRVKH